MSYEVCEAINEIDKNVFFDSKSQKYTFANEIYGVYCSPSRKGEKGQCDSSGKLLGSAFISLLNFFENVNDYEDNLKNEKLAEYAILWLNYKNDQNPKRLIGVYDIYDMLTRNEWFGKHYHSLKDKTGIMKIYFSYLNRLYALLKGICNTITKCNEDPSNASECLKQAQNCVKIYQYLSNNCPWYKDCTLYCNILSHLKNDYDKFREKYKTNNLPELKLPDGGQSCESLCKSKEQKFNAKKAKSENSKIDTSPTNSLSGQSSGILTGNRGYSLSGKEGERNEYDSTTDKSVNSMEKLKDSVEGYPYILGFQRNLRNKLQGLEGGSNWKDNVSFGQVSGPEIIGEISPKIYGLGGYVKKIIGGKQKLKGEEGESLGISGDQSGLRHSLSGLDGEFYGPYRGLSGRTNKFPGLKGEAYGPHSGLSGETWGLTGSEGDAYGQYSGLSGWSYGFPGLDGDNYGKYSGLRGRTQESNGQYDGSLGIKMSQPDLRNRLAHLEGDSNGQYDILIGKSNAFETIDGISPQMMGLSGHMEEFPYEEEDSLNTKHDIPHIKIESQNISTTIEDDVKSPRKIPTVFFGSPSEHSNSCSTSDSIPVSSLASSTVSITGSNFGNNVIYIVVPFVLILIILGISYKEKKHVEKSTEDEKDYKFV
ncbi:Plasmodium variant antigen protein Cir/Yir/Bir, putative [Plasmodium chabaudi chabaudi]|uniref:Plasmodium variant antigen protein Cir/Yir/Bir, putative n=1 Tax=Plasmodium chabaudi chabaudi TaxID=31271 RepID=A0A1C6WTI7_PLACU|nr:Plasmodium variant antigen protein Cir/Yir/Bir, putative [Plasmodium chabaudi chabaudi]